MKIVHAVYSMEVGGAEMLVAQLSRIQRARGDEVVVCAYSNLGTLGEILRSEGIEVCVLGTAHPLRTMQRYRRLFQKMRPDVVHCHNPAPTLQAAIAARLTGVPMVVATRHSLVSPPYDVAAEVKFSLVARFVNHVAGICEITCQNLRGAPLARRAQIVRVYNGAAAVTAPSSNGLEKDGFTLVFVGRVAAVKDLPTLLRAVALAAPSVSDLRLWIVGEGPVRPDLMRLSDELRISDRVTFYGQQIETDCFFTAADVLVMSSTSEGLPMSLVQAMSAGKPAIVTDVGGMGEVLRLSEGGLLVPIGDPKAMAQAIVRLAEDTDLRTTLGARALATYQAHFTLDRMADAYMALYRSAEGTAV